MSNHDLSLPARPELYECPDGVCECQYRPMIEATLALHHPEAICRVHHITISPSHTCAEPLLYRCATCARTSPQPCRTWRTLTGMDKP